MWGKVNGYDVDAEYGKVSSFRYSYARNQLCSDLILILGEDGGWDGEQSDAWESEGLGLPPVTVSMMD